MANRHGDKHGFKSRVILGEYRTPRMVVWLMKNFPGVVRTERQGGYVLFVLAVVVFFAAAGVLWSVAGTRVAPLYRSYAPDGNTQYQNNSPAR